MPTVTGIGDGAAAWCAALTMIVGLITLAACRPNRGASSETKAELLLVSTTILARCLCAASATASAISWWVVPSANWRISTMPIAICACSHGPPTTSAE